MDKLFLSKFNGEDVVVWNGAITTFHYVKELVGEDDDIRLATDEEKAAYRRFKK